ncbi:hypothetical protein Tco_0581364, partial [Tanacetum coccineum]
MSITKEEQQALDDALVPREQRLTIGTFLITTSVPAVYMQEFWATITYQKHHIRFKMNKKSYSFDMETFKNMLLICPKLPGQKFDSDTWGLYHQEKVDYVYLLWEDLVFQIKNKESRKNKYMFYPRFTKVIINHFMSQDQSIPRRNKVDWHMANDDPILTTMRFIPQHEVVQRYGAILPDYLTNPTMKESEAYKTYHDLATGKVQPKLKYVRRSSRTKTDEAPKPSSGKRVKSTAKVAKSGKKKQPALGLETLSEIALTESEQLKLATKRSLIQTHSSHASGSGVHKGDGVTPGVPDVPNYESDDEQISWKSSEEEDDDEVNVSEHDDDDDDERIESDNDGEDFVHPKFSTHDDEAMQEEVNEKDSFDPRVQTPSHVESKDDKDDDEEVQGVNIEGEAMDEAANNKEDEGNELYRDMNVNLEGRDVEMTDDQPTNVQTTQVTSLVDVLVTTIAEPPLVFATTLPLPPTPLITHMQQTLVPTPTIVPSSSLQDLPNFGSLFGFDHRLKTLETDFSEFKQTNQFAEAVSSILGIVDAYLANKMNEAVKIVVQLQSDRLRDEDQAENEDFINKLDDNIKKIIKDQVKEQVKAQVSKILPRIEKTVNEQLEAEVLTRSSIESKTSLAIAANLSELELKKILIEKMESNK